MFYHTFKLPQQPPAFPPNHDTDFKPPPPDTIIPKLFSNLFTKLKGENAPISFALVYVFGSSITRAKPL